MNGLVGGSRRDTVEASLQQPEIGKVRLTQSSRRLYDRLQNGLQVGRRAADDTEHVTRSGLVFERLYQLPFARLLRLEQPGILDGDHGLVGEGFEQFDLSISERADLGASD